MILYPCLSTVQRLFMRPPKDQELHCSQGPCQSIACTLQRVKSACEGTWTHANTRQRPAREAATWQNSDSPWLHRERATLCVCGVCALSTDHTIAVQSPMREIYSRKGGTNARKNTFVGGHVIVQMADAYTYLMLTN